jgi:thiosulfate reductase/polysulfide reductase chain A
VIAESAKQPFVSVRFPACEPLYESKPGWWIAKELAKRMGLSGFFPWQTPEEHLAALIEPMGVSAIELRSRGALAFPGRPYLEDRTADDDPPFGTASGKIELYSEELAGLGADPLPRFTPPEAPPAGYLRLIYGRAAVHSFARTQNNEALSALMPENEVWVHTQAARALSLQDGARVAWENVDGVKSLPVRVKVTEGIRPDCAFMVHGFGERSKTLRRARERGACDTELMTRVAVDPLMGGTGMRVNFVRPVGA